MLSMLTKPAADNYRPENRRLDAGRGRDDGHPVLAGLDVIPGRVLTQVTVDLPPDVIQVITLGQGRDNRQPGLYRRWPEATELTMIIRWCMGVTQPGITDQA